MARIGAVRQSLLSIKSLPALIARGKLPRREIIRRAVSGLLVLRSIQYIGDPAGRLKPYELTLPEYKLLLGLLLTKEGSRYYRERAENR